ncbi:unnamed protein product [Blepharisma stoltei]|uniref:Uncharacterized protein n=1 Tax=Blepharisma stoltei TaxID=1481888 RepID=A0AAU9JVB1_9CILI|nr:unnamed protein product [Blepharisma stoltei]
MSRINRQNLKRNRAIASPILPPLKIDSYSTPTTMKHSPIHQKMNNIKDLLKKLESTTNDDDTLAQTKSLILRSDTMVSLKVPQISSPIDSLNLLSRNTSKSLQNLDIEYPIDNLFSDMQKALSSLKQENKTQISDLNDVEDLIESLEFKAVRKFSVDVDTPLSPDLLSTKASQSSLTDNNKCIQVGRQLVEDLNVHEMERKHYKYMLDAFKNFRFGLEITSGAECIFPRHIKKENNDDVYKLSIEGNTKEINQTLESLVFRLKRRIITLSPSGGRKSTNLKPLATSRKSSVSSIPSQQRFSIYKTLQTPTYDMGSKEEVETELKLNCNLRLITLDPFLVTQTRDLPQYHMTNTRAKYDKIEYIQWKMPESADCRLNIDDILKCSCTQDRIAALSYFKTSDEVDENLKFTLDEEVTDRLLLYKILFKHKRTFRKIFISYNMESMSVLKDALSMKFATFIRLLKDCMLIGKDFEMLDGAKVFFVAFSNNKNKANEASKPWLHHLIKSYSFKDIYHLQLPNFIEALVRLVSAHPRYSKLSNIKLYQKFEIFYRRDLKPSTRMTQGLFYSKLIQDVHIMDTTREYSAKLYSLFKSHTVGSLQHSNRSDDKIELTRIYNLLDQIGILDCSQSMNKEINDNEDEFIFDEESPKNSPLKGKFNRVHYKAPAESAIYFPSSLVRKPENKNIKLQQRDSLRYGDNKIRHTLLPFQKPIRDKFMLDRYTAFSFYSSILVNNDEIWLIDPEIISDHDFVIEFGDFVDLMAIIGMYYWKTMRLNEELSMVEGVADFFEIITKAPTQNSKLSQEKNKGNEIIRSTNKNFISSLGKPFITATSIAQERYHQRRHSV